MDDFQGGMMTMGIGTTQSTDLQEVELEAQVYISSSHCYSILYVCLYKPSHLKSFWKALWICNWAAALNDYTAHYNNIIIHEIWAKYTLD